MNRRVDPGLDAAYNASASVESVEPYFERYLRESERVRTAHACELDLAYGTHPRDRLDLFAAPTPGAPLFVFIHGGYWRRLDKTYVSFVAERALAAGAACALLNYPLAPLASLDNIVESTRRALVWLATESARANARPNGFIVSGHSAGGHLSGMLAATDWEDYGLARGLVGGVLAVSGLFDLEPLRHTHIDEWLQLDDDSVARLSPQCHAPRGPMRVVAAVGGNESAEFIRQSVEYETFCAAAGNEASSLVLPGRNHFSVLYEFLDERSALSRTTSELLGGAALNR